MTDLVDFAHIQNIDNIVCIFKINANNFIGKILQGVLRPGLSEYSVSKSLQYAVYLLTDSAI